MERAGTSTLAASQHERRPTTSFRSGTDTGTRAVCLERLATALSGYRDLDATVRAEDPAPCLAVRNTAVPALSETVTVDQCSGGLVFVWSWGKTIGDTGDPDSTAQAIAYVLAAGGARLGAR